MIWLMAVTWPCHLDVEDYAGAGQTPFPPRLACPDCALPLALDGSYPRVVRHHGHLLRLRIRRGRCGPCGASHALLPDFVVAHRPDTAETSGAALAGAPGSSVPASTVAGWRRRALANHAALVAGVGAAAVTWSDDAHVVGADLDLAGLVMALWSSARWRTGPGLPRPWRLLNLVTGASWLATRVKSFWTGVGRVPVPAGDP